MLNRLLILTQYFPPEMGAPQSRLFETAKGLHARGWTVEIVTAMPNYPTGHIFPGYRGRFFAKEITGGLPVRRYMLYASNSRHAIPEEIVQHMRVGSTRRAWLFRNGVNVSRFPAVPARSARPSRSICKRAAN